MDPEMHETYVIRSWERKRDRKGEKTIKFLVSV